MYITIGVVLMAIGAATLLFAIRQYLSANKKVLPKALAIIGFLLLAFGILLVYLLLSGQLVLPLST